MSGNKRRHRIVEAVMNILGATDRRMTPEQLQAHLRTGQLNARGTHKSKRQYNRNDKSWRRES